MDRRRDWVTCFVSRFHGVQWFSFGGSLLTQRTVVPLRSEQAVHHDDRRPCNGRLIRRIVAVESQLDYIASYATARERPARHARGHRLKSPDARDVHFGRDRKGDTKDERGKE